MFTCSRRQAFLFYFARCPALPKITLDQAIQCHVYIIGLFHLHTCKLIKSMSLCVVDLSIASFRFKTYINLLYLIPDCWAVFIIIVIVFAYFRLLYISHSFHLQSHNTCRVWTNFPKTIRTNKIEKRAIMLFICTTKTIIGSPVF